MPTELTVEQAEGIVGKADGRLADLVRQLARLAPEELSVRDGVSMEAPEAVSHPNNAAYYARELDGLADQTEG